MTGRERCEEIMRLIDEALESAPPAAEGRARVRRADAETVSRQGSPPAARPRR